MNPALAILFAVSSAAAPSDWQEHRSGVEFSIGQVVGHDVTEYRVRSFAPTSGRFSTVAEFSATNMGDTWIGYGLAQTFPVANGLSIGLTFVPGLYIQGEGPDLGGVLNFRSGVELIYSTDRVTISIGYDHRSHAGINGGFNPGLDTIFVSGRIDF